MDTEKAVPAQKTAPKSDNHKEVSAPPPLLRGSLKLEASSATPIVSAGTEFSIYVIIRNPFPVPVTIYGTETHIPVELSDQIWRRNELKAIQARRDEVYGKTKHFWGRAGLRLRYALDDFSMWLNPPISPRVAIAVSPETHQTIETSEAPLIVNGSTISTDKGDVVFGSQWTLNFSDNITEDQIRQIFWDINEYKLGRQPVTLRPGDSAVQHFVLKTNQWLTFTPIAHTFQIQVRYEVDGCAHTDTIPFSLSIRAAVASTLIGSLVGSILGAVVNPQNALSLNNFAAATRLLLTSAIFALIIVVAFARKNSVQQIVSVEDFWGGVFIGFLVGYSGDSFIKTVLGSK